MHNDRNSFISLIEVNEFAAPDNRTAEGQVWLEMFKTGTWFHPRRGKVEVTNDELAAIANNFSDNALGIDVLVDYEHGTDPVKGKQVAGKITALNHLPDEGKMLGCFQFNTEAEQEVKAQKWRYLSPKWWDEYSRTDTGDKIPHVLEKVSLTNSPIFRGLAAINFADVLDDTTVTLPVEAVAVPAPNEKGNTEMDEAELRKLFGITDESITGDALTKHLEKVRDDAKAFAAVDTSLNAAKSFAQDYPAEFAQQQEDRKFRIEAQAKEFASEFLSPTEDSKLVLPPKAKDKLVEAYKAFANGEASVETLRDVLTSAREQWIDTAEHGRGATGDHENPDDSKNFASQAEKSARFAQKMREAMTRKDDPIKNPMEALEFAAKDDEEGYEAYKTIALSQYDGSGAPNIG